MGAETGIPLLLQTAKLMVAHGTELAQLACKQLESGGQTVHVNALRRATVQMEVVAIGISSLFESRLEGHFPGQRFFPALAKFLREDLNEQELATSVEVYSLAINVLKHGAGRSHNKLLEIEELPFGVKKRDQSFFDEGDMGEPEGLVDVHSKDFMGGLFATLEKAYSLLLEKPLSAA